MSATDSPAGDDRTSTRWLDVEEQIAWRRYLRASRLLDEELRRGLEEHGLSHPEYEILVRLSERDGHVLRMSELAAGVVSSRSRLTHTVARLEREGLVLRRVCSRDARGVECVLTPAGLQRLRAAAHTHVDQVRRHLLDVMAREQFLELGAAFALVADGLDPQGTVAI